MPQHSESIVEQVSGLLLGTSWLGLCHVRKNDPSPSGPWDEHHTGPERWPWVMGSGEEEEGQAGWCHCPWAYPLSGWPLPLLSISHTPRAGMTGRSTGKRRKAKSGPKRGQECDERRFYKCSSQAPIPFSAGKSLVMGNGAEWLIKQARTTICKTTCGLLHCPSPASTFPFFSTVHTCSTLLDHKSQTYWNVF